MTKMIGIHLHQNLRDKFLSLDVKSLSYVVFGKFLAERLSANVYNSQNG